LDSVESAQTHKPDWSAFVNALRQFPNVKRACGIIGVSRAAAYERRDKHTEFRVAWDEALQDATDDLEQTVWTRGTVGWRPPRCGSCNGAGKLPVDKGDGGASMARCPDCRGRGVDDSRDRPSDDLAKFLLRAHRPALYGKVETVKLDVQHVIEVEIHGLEVRPRAPEPAPASEPATEASSGDGD